MFYNFIQDVFRGKSKKENIEVQKKKLQELNMALEKAVRDKTFTKAQQIQDEIESLQTIKQKEVNEPQKFHKEINEMESFQKKETERSQNGT